MIDRKNQRELWYNCEAESLTLLTETFATLFAWLSDEDLTQIATNWVADFNYQQPIIHTPAYKALHELRDIASQAISRELPIVIYLFGSPRF